MLLAVLGSVCAREVEISLKLVKRLPVMVLPAYTKLTSTRNEHEEVNAPDWTPANNKPYSST